MREQTPLVVIGVLMVAGLFLLLRSGDQRLDSTVIGVQGLEVWLRDNDVPVQVSNRRRSPRLDRLSLRILPLYDTDLLAEAPRPETRAELMEETTQRDISLENLTTKLADMPGILVLPKWRTGVMMSETAHARFLIPERDFTWLLRQVGVSGLSVVRGENAFLRHDTGAGEIVLFNAQMIRPGTLPQACRTELSTPVGHLIVRCHLDGADHETLILADPDLLNNHGLALGDNAAFVLDWLRARIGDDDRPVYLDFSPFLLTEFREDAAERRDYVRDTDDLSRFFRFPFSVMWATLLAVLGVLYWRGAKRFGPVAALEDRPGHEQSKTAAISAKARLLRLSGNDGHMVSDYVRAQIRDMTVSTFGPDLGRAGTQRFYRHLARRDAETARAFQDCAEDLTNRAAQMSHGELMRRLNHYKSLLEKLQGPHGTR